MGKDRTLRYLKQTLQASDSQLASDLAAHLHLLRLLGLPLISGICHRDRHHDWFGRQVIQLSESLADS